jgi:AcrR family transcriptional regulator
VSTNSEPVRRDREATKQRLIQAAIEIIREDGFEKLGVNAIAERSGLSKVLIYRYFQDLSGLLRAAADELDPLQARAAERLMADVPPDAGPGDIIRDVVVRLHEALREDELTKQLLIWELTHENEVTRVMSVAREEVGLTLTKQFSSLLREKQVSAELDVNALLAVVTAGVFYLTLRSDSVREYNGVDIRSTEGWERIGATLKTLIDSVTE